MTQSRQIASTAFNRFNDEKLCWSTNRSQRSPNINNTTLFSVFHFAFKNLLHATSISYPPHRLHSMEMYTYPKNEDFIFTNHPKDDVLSDLDRSDWRLWKITRMRDFFGRWKPPDCSTPSILSESDPPNKTFCKKLCRCTTNLSPSLSLKKITLRSNDIPKLGGSGYHLDMKYNLIVAVMIDESTRSILAGIKRLPAPATTGH